MLPPQEGGARPARDPAGRPVRILFVCTEDWFFLSHFQPLVAAARDVGCSSPAIVTTTKLHRESLRQLGLEILDANFHRRSAGPVTTLRLLFRLIAVFRRLRPDILHLIAWKPIMLGGLAALALPSAVPVFHLTGLGFVGAGRSRRAALLRRLLLGLLAGFLRRRRSWLLVENREDLTCLQRLGVPVTLGRRATLLGGAGVDPELFAPLPPPANAVPRAAYVGRMVWSKGIDVLVEAHDLLCRRGQPLALDLFGAPDAANPRAFPEAQLEAWSAREGIAWHGPTGDVRTVWRKADFAVVPSRGGEGLPRVLLEAAACARPLIVTDVPGCRDFVRDGVEGLVVPPEDAAALADAMGRLARDPMLRLRMGAAARNRVLEGYTEAHVRKTVHGVYEILANTP